MANRLPKGLRRRSGRDGKISYYLKLADGVRELRLHGELDCVLAQWRTHQIADALRRADVVRISDLLEMFEKYEIPVRRTMEGEQCSYLIGQVRALIAFFKEHGNPEFFTNVPMAAEYLLWRGPSRIYRANGEVGLLNHIFNWARLHTPVQVGDCPWMGSVAAEALQEQTLRELGTAMAFYRNEFCGGNNDAGRHTTRDDATTGKLPFMAASTHHTDLNPAELREYSMSQLKRDGRPDLARALARLSECDIQRALALAAKATLAGTSPQLTLGTRRIPLLAALRRSRRIPEERRKQRDR